MLLANQERYIIINIINHVAVLRNAAAFCEMLTLYFFDQLISYFRIFAVVEDACQVKKPGNFSEHQALTKSSHIHFDDILPWLTLADS